MCCVAAAILPSNVKNIKNVKEVIFVSVRVGLNLLVLLHQMGFMLPSSCDGQLWTTDGAVMIRQKN